MNDRGEDILVAIRLSQHPCGPTPVHIPTHLAVNHLESNDAFPLASRNQTSPELYCEEGLVTVQFQRALVFHCSRVTSRKAFQGAERDSDVKMKRHLLIYRS